MALDHFLLFILCVLYGLFFATGKVALQFTAPIFFTGVRMILAGIILSSYCWFTRKPGDALTKKQWVYIFAVGLFGIYITNASEFWGLQFITAGKTSLICSFYPMITAIISWTLFSEKMTNKKILGLFIGTLGFVIVIIGKEPIEDISGSISVFSYAEIALTISTITTALGWLITRDAIKLTNLNIILLNGISMFIGGVMSMIHSYASEKWDPFPIYDMKKFLFFLVVIMITSNICSYNLHSYLLKRFTATYIAFANLVNPVFASFFGWLFLGEMVNYNFWISIICVVVGLSIYYRENLRLNE